MFIGKKKTQLLNPIYDFYEFIILLKQRWFYNMYQLRI